MCHTCNICLKICPSRHIFLHFSPVEYFKVNKCSLLKLPMAGEPGSSGVGNNHSTNCTTSTEFVRFRFSLVTNSFHMKIKFQFAEMESF